MAVDHAAIRPESSLIELQGMEGIIGLHAAITFLHQVLPICPHGQADEPEKENRELIHDHTI